MDGEQADPAALLDKMTSNKTPVYVLGVTGAANCGKTFYTSLFTKLGVANGLTVSILKERNFMKPISIKDEGDRANYVKTYNFDSPEAIDFDLFEVKFWILWVRDFDLLGSPQLDSKSSKISSRFLNFNNLSL